MADSISYLVQWEIELDAASPIDAAFKAWDIIRAEKSTSNVFTIFDNNGNYYHVDLQEIIENNGDYFIK